MRFKRSLFLSLIAVILVASGCQWRGGEFANPHNNVSACIVSAVDAEGKAVGSVEALGGVFVSPGTECNVNSLTTADVLEVETNLWARTYVNGIALNAQCSSSGVFRGLDTGAVLARVSGGCGHYDWVTDPDTEWYARSQASVFVYGNWYHSTIWWSPTEMR